MPVFVAPEETTNHTALAQGADGSILPITEKSDVEKKVERKFLVVIGAIILGFGILAWATDGKIVSYSIKIIEKFEPNPAKNRNAAANCQDPANINTPYCQDRAGEIESNWRSITRGGSHAPAFKLTDKK